MVRSEEVSAPFGAAELAAARRAAPARGLSIVATLEELSGLASAAFTQRLGLTLHYATAGIQDLHRWTPAFDALLVRSRFLPVKGVRLQALQQVFRGDELLAEARVTAVCVGPDTRPIKPPKAMIERLAPWCAGD